MYPLIGISGGEILIILVVFLVLFGAKSIPGLARNLGRAMRQFKDASQEIQREIGDVAGDVKKEISAHRRTMDQMMSDDPSPNKGPKPPPSDNPPSE